MANISKIALPNGKQYDIHDALAIHVDDVTALMDFKGTKATYNDLPKEGNKNGDVWLISQTGEEYIYDSAAGWVKLGYDIKAASTTHTHNVTVEGTNSSSVVSGNITVPKITREDKYISASATQGEVDKDTKKVLGINTKFTTEVTPITTNIKAVASDVVVAGNGTASAITALGAPTTATALGTNATFSVSGGGAVTSKMVTATVKNPSVNDVSIPNVTDNTVVNASKVTTSDIAIPNVTQNDAVVASKVDATAGTAASWNAEVSEDGVLSFSWTTNTPTVVNATDVNASKVTLGTALSASKVTATDVEASKVTLGTALSASKVTTSDITVATGTIASDGAGAPVVTGVNAITVAVNNADEVAAVTGYASVSKTDVLTGVKVDTQPTITLTKEAAAGEGVISVATGIKSAETTHNGDDEVDAIIGVTVAEPVIALSINGTETTNSAAIDKISIETETVGFTGTAEAQKWTQTKGTTDIPSNQ